jgi:hypothetical protein
MTTSSSLRVPRLTRAALAVAALVTTVAACASPSGALPAPPPSAPTAASSAPTASSSAPTAASSAPTAASGAPAVTPSGPATDKSAAPVPVESNPPGDIPDNVAFVKFTSPNGHYSFTHPEGWAQTGGGTQVRFTDKLNGVTVDSAPAASAPSVASATSADVARLKSSVPAFELRDISAASVPGGQAVRIVFRRNSDADPVTGKVYRDEVEEYLVFRAGRTVQLDLYGPVGADNVDAYHTMAQSLRIT